MKNFIKDMFELEKDCFGNQSWTEEQIKSHLESGKVFLLKENEQPIGYVLYYEYEDYLEIFRIGVKEEFQRRGYASHMLEELIAIGKSILLEVHEENKAAIQLYKKYNFQPLYLRKNYYIDGKSAIVMKRTLGKK